MAVEARAWKLSGVNDQLRLGGRMLHVLRQVLSVSASKIVNNSVNLQLVRPVIINQ